MLVKNEDWVLGLSARAALMWADELIIFLHDCSDHSANIAFEIAHEGGNITVMQEYDPVWREMAYRNRMLEEARKRGATHICIVDADEVLTGNLIPAIRQTIEGLKVPEIYRLPWIALPRTVDRYLIEGTWARGQNVTFAFPDDPKRFHWFAKAGYDFHHRPPVTKDGFGPPIWRPDDARLRAENGGLMHLQFLSERRLRAKQCLYQLTEVIRWPGRKRPEELAKMYGHAVYDSDPAKHASAECPSDWWTPYAQLTQFLEVNAEPWQERECKRLMTEHGPEKFRGLDLFGVV